MKTLILSSIKIVATRGIDPQTFWLQAQRSINWAMLQLLEKACQSCYLIIIHARAHSTAQRVLAVSAYPRTCAPVGVSTAGTGRPPRSTEHRRSYAAQLLSTTRRAGCASCTDCPGGWAPQNNATRPKYDNFKAKIQFWFRLSPTENITVWLHRNLPTPHSSNLNLREY